MKSSRGTKPQREDPRSSASAQRVLEKKHPGDGYQKEKLRVGTGVRVHRTRTSSTRGAKRGGVKAGERRRDSRARSICREDRALESTDVERTSRETDIFK